MNINRIFDLQNQAVRGKLVWTDEKVNKCSGKNSTIVIFLSNPPRGYLSWKIDTHRELSFSFINNKLNYACILIGTYLSSIGKDACL